MFCDLIFHFTICENMLKKTCFQRGLEIFLKKDKKKLWKTNKRKEQYKKQKSKIKFVEKMQRV